MRNNRLALTMTAALTAGCNVQKPEIKHQPTIVVVRPDDPNTQFRDEETLEGREGIQPDPVVEITERMRWRLHNNNQCDTNNWVACGQEVNRLFFDLTKKIPKAQDRRCRADGDYEPGCVEAVYEQIWGNDALITDFKKKEGACKNAYNECTAQAEAECGSRCWNRIKEELEEEKENREKEIEKMQNQMLKP